MMKADLQNPPNSRSGKYENRFNLMGNIKTFEVSGHFTGKYFHFEALCGRSASVVTNFPLVGHQCSHKDNNSADHRPQIVVASSRLQFISKDMSLVFLYIRLRHQHILLLNYCLPAGAKYRVRVARARETSSCEAKNLRSRQGASSAASVPHCCASRGSAAHLLF